MQGRRRPVAPNVLRQCGISFLFPGGHDAFSFNLFLFCPAWFFLFRFSGRNCTFLAAPLSLSLSFVLPAFQETASAGGLPKIRIFAPSTFLDRNDFPKIFTTLLIIQRDLMQEMPDDGRLSTITRHEPRKSPGDRLGVLMSIGYIDLNPAIRTGQRSIISTAPRFCPARGDSCGGAGREKACRQIGGAMRSRTCCRPGHGCRDRHAGEGTGAFA